MGPEDSVSFGQATMLGIQHVLAMDVYVVPVIIASIIGISTASNVFFNPSDIHSEQDLPRLFNLIFLYEITSCARPFIYSNQGQLQGIYFANNQQGNGWGAVLGC